jgi:parvulin-like peptidyl-prolyl isomerase
VRRLFLPLALAVLIAVTLGVVIGGVTSNNAVVVNGASLSQRHAESQLAAASSNPAYLCYLNANQLVRTSGQSGLGPVQGSSASSYSSTFVTLWMDQEITNLIVEDAVNKLGLSEQATAVSRAAKADLVASINATLGRVNGTRYQCATDGAAILQSLPASFATTMVQAQANSEALLSHFGGIGLDLQSLEQFYNTAPTSFDTMCVSGILVSSQATAQSLRSEILNGADFATLAQQNSLDASKSKGGALGCFTPSSSNYAAVFKDVGSLAIGEVSQPLPSSNSQYVILMLTSRTATPFAGIVQAVRNVALQKDATTASKAASELVRTASVYLNPRYGTWNVSIGQAGVTPPASPPTSSILNVTANVPGASG